MKNKKAGLFIALGLLAIPLVYVLAQVVMILYDPYVTQTAIRYSMADSIRLDGLVCFEEQPVPGEGRVGYLVRSGERVSVGAPVAELYSSPEQARGHAHLQKLEHQIDLLQHSRTAAGTDVNAYLSQAQAGVYDLLDAIDRGDYTGLGESRDRYLTATNRLQVMTGRAGDLDGTLNGLRAEQKHLAAAVGQTRQVTAPVGGYFVAAAHFQPTGVSAGEAADASPAELRSLLEQEPQPAEQDGLAGRIVTSYRWQFHGLCTADESRRFEVGQKVHISFPGRMQEPMPARVTAVQLDEEEGIAKITVECEYIGSELLSLAHQEAQIDFEEYSGLRISTEALHIVDGQKGVYVRSGNLLYFKKISILYQNEDYLLVPEDGGEDGASEVRMFDEVVVSGSGLKDKKLL